LELLRLSHEKSSLSASRLFKPFISYRPIIRIFFTLCQRLALILFDPQLVTKHLFLVIAIPIVAVRMSHYHQLMSHLVVFLPKFLGISILIYDFPELRVFFLQYKQLLMQILRTTLPL
jgi:hypothetical protein